MVIKLKQALKVIPSAQMSCGRNIFSYVLMEKKEGELESVNRDNFSAGKVCNG